MYESEECLHVLKMTLKQGISYLFGLYRFSDQIYLYSKWDSTCIAVILITESSCQKAALENLETSL